MTRRVAKSVSVVAFRESAVATAAERSLRLQGVELDTTLIVDSFLALPHLVADSSRIALIESRLARRACAQGDVRMVALPQVTSPLIETFWWHPTRTADPEHASLRSLIQDAAATLPPVPPPS
ncbi:LysR substrate-binding domain-containing protein [Streptomyces sp. NPDC058045]|uniref:LysR substrate-binding domain-containing protein n=1 Tax=Streptomyces sp. NPDC058045 TaxID=3346311 RepID=UPI0036E75D34